MAVLLVLVSLGLLVEPGSKLASTADTSPATNAILRDIVVTGHLSELRWPNVSDYAAQLKEFYEPSGYALVWVRNNEPTPQAQAVIEVLQHADGKGLHAEDYDSSRWADRFTLLRHSPPSANDQARFDAALTVCVIRYVSDLHVGRVNPRHLRFNLDVGPKRYDLPSFLREKIVSGTNEEGELDAAEPPFPGYKRAQRTLQQYLDFAQHDVGEQLPVPAKPVDPGGAYEGIPPLTRLLRLLGDLPSDVAAHDAANLYDEELVEAVKHFQMRHGLAPEGRLGPQTLKQMNIPLTFRVEQLRLTLERWRWVPYEFPQPPIVVNIPEFRLRAYNADGKIGLSSNVIVGKAYRSQTPVLERDMKFLVFRPYWNVPPGIFRSQVLPAIIKDHNYVADKGFEVTTPQGIIVTSGEITDEVLQQLSAGRLLVRQKPGPSNALGLVKLMFPNEYHVYLHSTPAQELFSQSRRDFSAGCIRVEQAAELAAWVLRDKPEWSLERVRTAMQSGKDNVHINLGKPVPVLILYGTAVVDEENQVHFFDDIYGHDAALEKVLSRGYPYPQ